MPSKTKPIKDLIKDLDVDGMVARLEPHRKRRERVVDKAVRSLREAQGISRKTTQLEKQGKVLAWLEQEAGVMERQRQDVIAGGDQDPGAPVEEPKPAAAKPPRPLPSEPKGEGKPSR